MEVERDVERSHLRFLGGGIRVAERRCHYYGRLFVPDPRVGNRQKACSNTCQRLRKRENNRVFREKNPEYGRAPERYEYLKEWRRKHPDYQRRWRERRKRERPSGEIKAERSLKRDRNR